MPSKKGDCEFPKGRVLEMNVYNFSFYIFMEYILKWPLP